MKYALILLGFLFSSFSNASIINYDVTVNDSDTGLLFHEFDWSVNTDLEGFQFNFVDGSGVSLPIQGAEYAPSVGLTYMSFNIKELGLDWSDPSNPKNYVSDISLELMNNGVSVYSSLIEANGTLASVGEGLGAVAPSTIFFDTLILSFSPVLYDAGEQQTSRTPSIALYIESSNAPVQVPAPASLGLMLLGFIGIARRKR